MAGDCDDDDPARFPGQPEACNGRDDDCDPTSDEGYAWMGSPLGASCACESGARTGVVECATATMASCDFPAEACNGRDDDCDGTDDDGFDCVANTTSTCTVTNAGCTATGTRRCDAVTCSWETCELPPETCDGVDSDCDGFVDDGALATGPQQPVVSAITISEIAWHPTAGQGGAIAYFVDGSPRRLYFQRVDSSGVPVGAPLRIAEGNISFRMGLGWDGEQWAVFYPIDVASNDWQLHVVRVTSAGVASTPVSLGQRCETVRAHGNGSALGVVWMAGGSLMRGAIYARGAWTRTPFDLMSIPGTMRFTNDYDVVPAGGDDHVMVTTVDDGSVRFRVFDPTSLQTERSILTDPDLEYPLRAAVIGNRLALGWRDGGVDSAAGVFDLGTGAVVRTNALDRVANDVHVVVTGGVFLVASTVGAQRMRTDGTLFPERINGFALVNAGDLVATPGGRWTALRVVVPGSSETIVQGLGCP
ncbi:putative metal-binding motif-containing protein [Sandaracinus amylolyticus]|uniref:putative metal-binding motif-containing protein n=1 Tax=Sandaracinus amylolyticus TaxID=927083 RepID=UPI003AF38652